MKIYAISDTHFGHHKLEEKYGRMSGFGAEILNNIEKVHGDLLIHCGDFCMGDDARHHAEFMNFAKGFKRKVLVLGNHDHKSSAWYIEQGWDFVCEAFTERYFGKNILFTHIPQPKMFNTDFNVHGHMHGNTHRLVGDIVKYYEPGGYHRDLAPELHDYRPVSLDKLIGQ